MRVNRSGEIEMPGNLDDEPEVEVEPKDALGYQLDAAYRNVDRLLYWVAGADNKALIALTFEGVMIVGVASTIDRFRSVIVHSPLIWQGVVVAILLLALLACLSVSILKLFHAISPRIVRSEKQEKDAASLMFFQGIAEMDRDEYAVQMRRLKPPVIREGLARIAHITAQIATQKYADLNVAYRYLGYQVVLFLAVLLVTLLAPV